MAPGQEDRKKSAQLRLLGIFVVAGVVAGLLLAAVLKLSSLIGGADPETVASASLQAMREQARLTPFTARYVAIVTSTQSRLILSSEKTLIMPGTVRYEIDLAKLRQRDLRWDEASRTLRVTLPPLEISEPEIRLDEIREYGSGGLRMMLTGGEEPLDAANRRRGRRELMEQARSPMPMRLARDAARRAIERSFEMPLRAAGIEATVRVRFPEEGTDEPSRMDASRRIEDVVAEEKAKGAAGRR